MKCFKIFLKTFAFLSLALGLLIAFGGVVFAISAVVSHFLGEGYAFATMILLVVIATSAFVAYMECNT